MIHRKALRRLGRLAVIVAVIGIACLQSSQLVTDTDTGLVAESADTDAGLVAETLPDVGTSDNNSSVPWTPNIHEYSIQPNLSILPAGIVPNLTTGAFEVHGFLQPSSWMDPMAPSKYAHFEPKTMPSDCPKVYIYDMSFATDFGLNDLQTETLESAYGTTAPSPSLPGVRYTEQFNLARILTYRLMRSRCRTTDPREADLFMIPLSRGNDMLRTYAYGRCGLRNNFSDFRAHLEHLNASTVQRHFFVNSFHWPMARWACLRMPEPLIRDFPLELTQEDQDARALMASVPWVNIEVKFARTQRLRFPLLAAQMPHSRQFLCGGAHAQFAEPKGIPVGKLSDCNIAIINMPRPTCIHWNRQLSAQGIPLPWTDLHRNRDVLVSYIGRRAEPDEYRWPVQRLCDKYQGSNKLVCEQFRHRPHMDRNEGCKESVALKARSVFCLDPAGDTPGRRSTIDSYIVGCIPVFLGIVQAFLYPEQWAGWYDSAFLVLDEERINADMDDIVELLEAVPQSTIAYMQWQISRHAHRFVYNEEDIPGLEDGAEYLLRGLQARVTPAGR